jgi:hypothetical protein
MLPCRLANISTASCPRRLESSSVSVWQPKISHTNSWRRLPSSRKLRAVSWQLAACQARLLEDGTDMLSRNVAKQLTNLRPITQTHGYGSSLIPRSSWQGLLYFCKPNTNWLQTVKQNSSRNATTNAQLSLQTNEISRPTNKPSFISPVKAYQIDPHTTFQSPFKCNDI